MLAGSGADTPEHVRADHGGQLLNATVRGRWLTPAGAGLLHAAARWPFPTRDFRGRRANTSGRIFSAGTPVSSTSNMTQ